MTLYGLLHTLDRKRLHYEIARHRDETVMVKVAVPGERWEVEFFEDGRVEVEVFRSAGGIEGAETLARMLEREDAFESGG